MWWGGQLELQSQNQHLLGMFDSLALNWGVNKNIDCLVHILNIYIYIHGYIDMGLLSPWSLEPFLNLYDQPVEITALLEALISTCFTNEYQRGCLGKVHEHRLTWICLRLFFYGLYRGKSPSFTTIWENIVFSKHRTSKSKLNKGFEKKVLPWKHSI